MTFGRVVLATIISPAAFNETSRFSGAAESSTLIYLKSIEGERHHHPPPAATAAGFVRLQVPQSAAASRPMSGQMPAALAVPARQNIFDLRQCVAPRVSRN